MSATHVLIHRLTPGVGPQPGTPEHDAEMREWQRIDGELRNSGVLVDAFALQDLGSRVTGDTSSAIDASDGELVFAVHAIAATDDAHAQAVARQMPSASYGSIEVRPVMA